MGSTDQMMLHFFMLFSIDFHAIYIHNNNVHTCALPACLTTTAPHVQIVSHAIESDYIKYWLFNVKSSLKIAFGQAWWYFIIIILYHFPTSIRQTWKEELLCPYSSVSWRFQKKKRKRRRRRIAREVKTAEIVKQILLSLRIISHA